MKEDKSKLLKELEDKVINHGDELVSNLERISVLIDEDKVEEYLELIEKNDELIKEITLVKKQLVEMKMIDDGALKVLAKIEWLSEMSIKFNQINIEKLSEKVLKTGEENLEMSQKIHASRVYSSMQYDI